MSAAGAGSDPLYVENVFKTYLYRGTGSNITINNGIDLSGEGGFVWYRRRDGAENNSIEDTVRGLDKVIYTDASNSEADPSSYGLQAFNSNGFTAGLNTSGGEYTSWTWRKAPNFCDIITYTGNGTAGRTISHNLGTTVGSVWIKRRDSARSWMVYHRGIHSSNPEYYHLSLNANFTTTDLGQSQSSPSNMWNQTAPTSTQITLGSDQNVNENGGTYVAYVFAHNNNGDGGFGPDADQDVIKCGSYTGDGGTNHIIDVGFEPQWVLIKKATGSGGGGSWAIFDCMRGLTFDTGTNRMLADSSGAEYEDNSYHAVGITSNGFRLTRNENWYNYSGYKYIYIAIRRGPMAIPESSSSCFAIETRGETSPNPPAFNASFDVDFSFRGVPSASFLAARQIQRGYVSTTATAAFTSSNSYVFDFSNGWWDNSSTSTSDHGYMWGRAPHFCDVVCHKGNGTNHHAIEHNLGIAPEMIWTKCKSSSKDWGTYVLGEEMYLNTTNSSGTDRGYSQTYNPTATHFYLGTVDTTNETGSTYISFLFATLAGVSKVGSYTGNGSSQNIDCGFSNGSKLVIIKPSSASGGWHLYDTDRSNGLVAGNDTSYDLDSSTNYTADAIDPLSSGFTVNSTGNLTNSSGVTYIFYAIAA